jgi:hypothetical protein
MQLGTGYSQDQLPCLAIARLQDFLNLGHPRPSEQHKRVHGAALMEPDPMHKGWKGHR